jgi:hypothetical protein
MFVNRPSLAGFMRGEEKVMVGIVIKKLGPSLKRWVTVFFSLTLI